MTDIVHDQWMPGWAFGAVDGLLKEIDGLRKAVAAKDAALRLLVLSADELQSKCEQDDPDVIAVRLDIDDAQAALASTPPSGMVCVTLAQLREIESTGIHVTVSGELVELRHVCPICKGPTIRPHAWSHCKGQPRGLSPYVIEHIGDCFLAAAIARAEGGKDDGGTHGGVTTDG